jgi:hypothetical protein
MRWHLPRMSDELSSTTRIVLTPAQLVALLVLVLGIAGFLTDLRFQVSAVRAAVVEINDRLDRASIPRR